MTTGDNILHKVLPNGPAKLLAFVYLVAGLWWFLILLTRSQDTLANNSYGLILGLIPFIGGLSGLYISRQWGSWSSAIGKSIILLSLGLITWSIGTFIFAGYYNLYADVEVPYPSLADVSYIISWPLWVVGMMYLSKATGARFGIRSLGGKLILLLVPLVAIVLSYYLLVVVARGGSFDFSESELLQIMFDLLYPIGDVVILTMAAAIYVLSYKYFGGQYKKAIYALLGGFILMYLADFSFSYTTTLETFYVGDWVDFLFTTAVFGVSYALVLFDRRVLTSQNSQTT